MKSLIGEVVSDKMQKTVTVRVWRWVKHPLYEKRFKKFKKYHADNTAGANGGDQVKIVQTRPLAKTKRWKVVEILEKK